MTNVYGKLDDEVAFPTAASTLGASRGYVKDQVSKVDGADLHHYSGTGSPGGKVTAPVGATYVDTAATNGAIRWVKTRGTGNTGWAVEYGDTGWRNITNEYLAIQVATGNVLTLGAGAKILVRKTGDSLIFGFQGEITANRNWTNLFQLPSSFTPDLEQAVPMPNGGRLQRNSGWIQLSGLPIGSIASAGKVSVATFPYVATNWPTTLPGTPA